MSNFHENDGKNNTYQCVRTMLFASDAASIATAEADATLPANGANKEGWYVCNIFFFFSFGFHL